MKYNFNKQLENIKDKHLRERLTKIVESSTDLEDLYLGLFDIQDEQDTHNSLDMDYLISSVISCINEDKN